MIRMMKAAPLDEQFDGNAQVMRAAAVARRE
jgi:hypothetical protein